jgi:hypothetical protein
MLTLLMLAALGAQPKDILFVQAQECWVRQATVVASLDEVLPARHAYLIRRLGDGHKDCRDVAEFFIGQINDERARTKLLAWGMMMADAEIRQRSIGMFNRMFICPGCGGTRECGACNGKSDLMRPCPRDCNYEHRCTECDGSGDTRFRKNFLGEFVEVDFFRYKGNL